MKSAVSRSAMTSRRLPAWISITLLRCTSGLLNITFINDLDVDCSLFWHGTNAGPRKDFGPVPRGGGRKVLEVAEGHLFTFARAGTLLPLLRITIDPESRSYVINQENAAPPAACAASTADATPGSLRCSAAKACDECVQLPGCGWSTVRHGCVAAHAVATTRTCLERVEEEERSAEQWLQLAEALMDPETSEFEGLASLRAAFEALENGRRVAESADSEGSNGTLKSILRWQAEVRPKLEAVLDDLDAEKLIATSRHASLASLKPRMVARRKLADAMDFISRAEPVVITDLFDGNLSHPVVQKWTLEYLRRFMHGGFYNVAADAARACCQYYEPRRIAAEAGYPYPFRPRTHLYRDHFEGFVGTLRESPSETEPRLHYLHDILMERDAAPVVAGEAATPQIAADLEEMVTALKPLARMQPFFGGVANAKLWIGQKGVTMPLHYDSTDNLYVMAWGRKRAILADPGQYEALYPYPNAHPLAGSSQVNLSNPDLARHPGFVDVLLTETVVGPGDVLYLPGYWWHQFEQPFEDTASVNLWSYELSAAPPASMRDARLRGSALHDHMEREMVKAFKSKAGVVLSAMASGSGTHKKAWVRANRTLHEAAQEWRRWMASLPNVADTAEPSELVKDFLQRYRGILAQRWPDWAPGVEWNLSEMTALEARLEARCEPAPKTATYASVCRWPQSR
ncbi:HIF1AN [Symbiodinium sp. CCMP2456]|nr:HIF1AN [Symbiodinium sp. CCMP2456]